MKSLNHSDLYNDSTTEKKMYNKKENVNNLQGKKKKSNHTSIKYIGNHSICSQGHQYIHQ